MKFDGIDIFHAAPHTNIDFTEDEVKWLADKAASHGLAIGSIVAPVWPPVGGGSAMGSAEDRKKFVGNVRKSCELGKRLRELGVRKYGVIRIDSAASPAEWVKDPVGNTKLIAQTWREACDVAKDYGERLAAEGEICWGGMHSWKAMIDTHGADGPPRHHRLPGRHGAYAALHHGLQRARGGTAARRLRLEGPGRSSMRRSSR